MKHLLLTTIAVFLLLNLIPQQILAQASGSLEIVNVTKNKVILKLTVSLRFRCFIFLQLSILHASFRRVYEDPASSYRVVADGAD